MIGLNHILLFLAVVSPLAVLARARRPDPSHRGWRVAAILVLSIAASSWLFFRNSAGYIAGGAWLALLFLPAVGLRRVADLTARQRFKSARKLAKGLQILHPSAELRQEVQLLRTLESRQDAGEFQNVPAPPAQDRHRNLRTSPAVLILILLNAAAFLFEIGHRQWQEPLGLHRLGALEPFFVVYRHEYWRLLTALFLHYDVVHLGFNLFALYVLGPPLERAIGAVRFVACYLISGLGSSVGVVALTRFHLAHADQLVGASGCIMGIVGAWAAFLLQHRHAALGRQRLTNVAMIVAIQVVFDLSTPQVSMAAHLSGLIAGFAIGLVLARKKISI
ncbi:MAG: rhomboid family intramembrane serine protease [Spartobacteria bacterium]